MKKTFTIIAFLGLMLLGTLIVAVATIVTILKPASYRVQPSISSGYEWIYILMYVGGGIFSIIGVSLALIGGFNGKPRYLNIGLMVIGVLYILFYSGLFYYLYQRNAHPVGGEVNSPWILYILLLPGLVSILGGIILRNYKAKSIQAV
jgi:hypothetical protein